MESRIFLFGHSCKMKCQHDSSCIHELSNQIDGQGLYRNDVFFCCKNSNLSEKEEIIIVDTRICLN